MVYVTLLAYSSCVMITHVYLVVWSSQLESLHMYYIYNYNIWQSNDTLIHQRSAEQNDKNGFMNFDERTAYLKGVMADVHGKF